MGLEPGGVVGDEGVGCGVAVVDDEVVRDEVVVACNLEVIRPLLPRGLDGDDPIPEHVTGAEGPQTVVFEVLAQPPDDSAG